MNNQQEKIMEIQFTLPGKHRPRVMKVPYNAPIDAFRQVTAKYPGAEFISFDGHPIRKKA